MPLANLQEADELSKRRGKCNQGGRQTMGPLILRLGLALGAMAIMLKCVGCVVVHQVRFISSPTGRTDYALAGESIELSCHYLMKDDLEDIKTVIWSKDGMNFLRWKKKGPGLEVLDWAFKGRFDSTTTKSHLLIHNVTIDMHGKYRCWIRTDLGSHENDYDLTVVSQPSCKLNDWRITSQQMECRETFRLDCRHMFPMPRPACGLWNSRTEKFLWSIPLHITEEPASPVSYKQTYRVQLVKRFDLIEPDGGPSELLQYAGHLIFKCDIQVPETSWKLSISHKMFDFSDGCEQDPLEAIKKMRASLQHYALRRLNETIQFDRLGRNQHLQMVEDQQPLASVFNVEVLPPSELKRLARLNKLGGEPDQDANASDSKSAGRFSSEDLNCWRKPRIGTIVKLSCAAADNAARRPHQTVRLTGSNLLECRPNGWNLIRESNEINNEILDRKMHRTRASTRRKLTANHLWPGGTTTRAPTSNASAVETDRKSQPDLSNKTASPPTEDVDDDDDSSTTDNAVVVASSSPTTEVEASTIPILATSPVEPPPNGLPDGEEIVMKIQDFHKRPPEELSLEQLAELLPNCVAVSQKRRNYKQKANGFSPAGSNAIMQGSTDERNNYQIANESPSQQDLPSWRWHFSWSNSSASDRNLSTLTPSLVFACCAILLASFLVQRPTVRLDPNSTTKRRAGR